MESVTSGDEPVRLAIHTVKVHINAAQSGVIQFLRPISEQDGIGGQRNTLNTVNAHETTDNATQILSNQRLTACQADLTQP
jgi:hypothetical protein